ncbi:MAG: LysR family transcriptional regulator [Lachnospiraceae bacterium]|nr:LysR family transcriptional regulator [Lachnospiraceae bacterium]
MVNYLEYYKVFVTVARCKSLTLAAEKLSISQPAVSQSLKQLEQAVETKLFVRTSKGVTLTEEGAVLYAYVSKGYEQMEMGERKLYEMRHLDAGEIRIGASDMTLQFYLLPFLEIFHESHPGIKVTVTNAPTPETLQNLRDGMIDFGVVSTPFENREGLRIRTVREIEDIFVAGRRFIPYKNKTLDFQELEKLPLISLEKGTSTRTYMDTFLRENHVELHPEFELATSDMIVQFALRSLGIGMIVKDFAKADMESGRLFALRFNKMIPKRQICVVTDEKKIKSVAADELLAIIDQNTGKK